MAAIGCGVRHLLILEILLLQHGHLLGRRLLLLLHLLLLLYQCSFFTEAAACWIRHDARYLAAFDHVCVFVLEVDAGDPDVELEVGCFGEEEAHGAVLANALHGAAEVAFDELGDLEHA